MNTKEIDKIIEQSREAWGAPGVAVAIVKRDEVLYLKGCGVKEMGKPDPITPDSLFAIASTTKAFTCTAIAMQAEEGLLQWDDPVRKHIPFFHLSDPLADANVTLRDLVTHRTGVSRHDLLWFYSNRSREEIIRQIGVAKPNTSFRSTYEYNNIMYLTAGYASGSAEKSSWESVVQHRILNPLGMTNTFFSIDDAMNAPDHATPHETSKEGVMRVVPWTRVDNCAPGGCLNSSVRDLSKWLRFQINEGEFEGKRLLSQAKLKETHTPQIVVPMDDNARELMPHTRFNCYGLGWAIFDYQNVPVVSHGGWLEGFRTQVALLPEEKFGIAIVCNHTPSRLTESLRNRLMDHLLGLPETDWDGIYIAQQERLQAEERAKEQEREEKRHRETQPSLPLEAYTGTYQNPVFGEANIVLEAGNLKMQWSFVNDALTHFHLDTFRLKKEWVPVDELLTFTLDKAGEVVAFQIMGNDFQRVKRG